MKQTTTEFQIAGSTIFLLEKTGASLGKKDDYAPVLQNRVMIQVMPTSKTLSASDVEYLTKFITHALNQAINDKQSVFREVLVKDVEEDDDDQPDLEQQVGRAEYQEDR
jgi:hypothetical protein